MALLPWERLPLWVLGPILTLIGASLLFDEEPYSWGQMPAVAMVFGGGWMFVSGVRKLIAERDARAPVTRRGASQQSLPNYATYSESELRHVLTRINRERFPERVAEIEARLSALEFKQA